MPTSALVVWPELINLVHQVPHRHILDVGPGWGKAAVLLREYLNEKPSRIDAVEMEKSYVDAHGLCALYDDVRIGDVCDMTADEFDAYDVVLMGDVLEHIDDARAFSLLQRIRPRVVISTPVAWFHTDEGLPESEMHRSHWTESSWDAVGDSRLVEVLYKCHGAWLVRLGPLDE
jgi:2-polyprenyl-3-methyl-5-hydroxy-6-metoxy-1,4-benzoquinol methylase